MRYNDGKKIEYYPIPIWRIRGAIALSHTSTLLPKQIQIPNFPAINLVGLQN